MRVLSPFPSFIFDTHTHSPQVALRIIVPKIQSTNEKVGLLALTVSDPIKLLYSLVLYMYVCTHHSVIDMHTHVHVHYTLILYQINVQCTCTCMCIVGALES